MLAGFLQEMKGFSKKLARKEILARILRKNMLALTFQFYFLRSYTVAFVFKSANFNPKICSFYKILFREKRGRQNFNESNIRKTKVFIISHLDEVTQSISTFQLNHTAGPKKHHESITMFLTTVY